MSLTPEEREDIINAACERALLKLPEVVGNLIMSKAATAKLSADFYKDHPELKGYSDLVAGTVEFVEGKNPGVEYAKILELALPEIRSRLKVASTLDLTTTNDKPQRHVPSLVESTQGVL